MTWIAPAVAALQILLLLHAALTDIATRLIHNEVCLILALLGVVSQFAGPAHLTESLIAATLLFLMLIVVYVRGWIGGGDVKLLTALAVGLPLAGLAQLLTVTAFSGAALALVHLMMRLLPQPGPAPSGSSILRRVCAVERWRHRRQAPLPYGAAIACGGAWALLNSGHLI